MSEQQLDPVSVAVALFTVLLGPAVANIVGAYAVIIIGASIGAGWALGRRHSTSRLSAAGFFLRINFMALLLTVSLAEIARALGVHIEVRWLLAPAAILIGGIGDDWPAVGGFFINRAGRFIDMWIEMRSGSRTPKPPVGDDQ